MGVGYETSGSSLVFVLYYSWHFLASGELIRLVCPVLGISTTPSSQYSSCERVDSIQKWLRLQRGRCHFRYIAIPRDKQERKQRWIILLICGLQLQLECLLCTMIANHHKAWLIFSSTKWLKITLDAFWNWIARMNDLRLFDILRLGISWVTAEWKYFHTILIDLFDHEVWLLNQESCLDFFDTILDNFQSLLFS